MRDVAKGIGDEKKLLAVASYLSALRPKGAAAPPKGSAGDQLGRTLGAICIGCHGTNGEGNAELAAPRIAGLPAWYTETQLRAFKTGERGGHPDDKEGRQMVSIMESLGTDDAIRAVAAYAAGLAGKAGR